MRARVVGGGAVAAVVAAGWGLAAYLLWRSSVPALHLPHLDPHAYFSNRRLERTASYARGARLLWLFEGGTLCGAIDWGRYSLGG